MSNPSSPEQRSEVRGHASGWGVYLYTGNLHAGVWHWWAHGPRGSERGTEATESVATLRAKQAEQRLNEGTCS